MKSPKHPSMFTYVSGELEHQKAMVPPLWLQGWESLRVPLSLPGGDFLTPEHCEHFIVQRTLMEQHFGLFVCLYFPLRV